MTRLLKTELVEMVTWREEYYVALWGSTDRAQPRSGRLDTLVAELDEEYAGLA